jgi:hypothetical protein
MKNINNFLTRKNSGGLLIHVHTEWHEGGSNLFREAAVPSPFMPFRVYMDKQLLALRVYVGFTRAPAGVCPSRGSVYISLRRTTNGHMCTLDSGGVLALHL